MLAAPAAIADRKWRRDRDGIVFLLAKRTGIADDNRNLFPRSMNNRCAPSPKFAGAADSVQRIRAENKFAV